MAEVLILHVGDQADLVEVVELHRGEPGAQEATRVGGREGPAAVDRAVARVALAQQALGHAQDDRRVGRARPASPASPRPSALAARAIAACAHLAALPWAPPATTAPGAHVREELLWRARRGSLRPGAPDVNARVVVRAAHARAVERRHVARRRAVQLARARPVADLPDVEQLRQAPAVARAQRSGDLVVGVGQSAQAMSRSYM